MRTNYKNKTLFNKWTLLVLFMGCWGWVHAGESVCYVSETGTGNGASWSSSTDLSTALADFSCTEIWVKSGTYYPTDDNDRTIRFEISRTLQLYGGFAGDETALGQRVAGLNPSTLSGNIGDPSSHEDNSEQVLYIDGSSVNGNITASTVIDGFTITHGYGVDNNINGSGLYCNGLGTGNECSPVLNNINFIENTAKNGGAFYSDGDFGGISNPVVLNSTFANNTADVSGGAFYSQASNGTSSPVFENVTFYANYSGNSGAVMSSRSFSGNSSPLFSHVTFYENYSHQNGGLFAIVTSNERPSYFTVRNSIIWANSARIDFQLVFSDDVKGEFTDSVIDAGCSPGDDVEYSCINIINEDPMMSQLSNNGGFTLTALPGLMGSAVDALLVQACPNYDQRGVLRPQGQACDIGAVEMRNSDDVIFKNNFEG